MDLREVKLAIFDMDGTMFDTETLSNKGWRVAVAKQAPDISDELFNKTFNSMLGTNMANCRRIANELLPGFDFDIGNAECYAFMDEYMNTHGVPIKPGLLELLDKLEELGIKKCVATSTDWKRATHKLEKANVLHRFEVVVGGDQVKISKPDPEIFLKAADACKVKPEYCVVLEDSAAGTEGGYRAGMRVIHIPDILQPSEETRNMSTVICKDLHEAISYITSCQA